MVLHQTDATCATVMRGVSKNTCVTTTTRAGRQPVAQGEANVDADVEDTQVALPR